jgi:hypothetical protein
MKNCVTDVQQQVPCAALVDGLDSVVILNVYPFHPRGKWPTVEVLTFQILAVSLGTTRFNIQKFYMVLALH